MSNNRQCCGVTVPFTLFYVTGIYTFYATHWFYGLKMMYRDIKSIALHRPIFDTKHVTL